MRHKDESLIRLYLYAPRFHRENEPELCVFPNVYPQCKIPEKLNTEIKIKRNAKSETLKMDLRFKGLISSVNLERSVTAGEIQVDRKGRQRV